MKTKLKTLSCYYDILSPHSWILFERLCHFQSNKYLKIQFKPVCAANVLTATGNKIPYYTPPLKKIYFKDIRFLGRLHDIPINTPWEKIDELLLQTTINLVPQYFLTMIDSLYPKKLILCSKLMWQMLWIENGLINEKIETIIHKANLPLSLITKLNDEEWVKLLNKRHLEVIQSGGFGIPWIVIQNENNVIENTYFGSDRWPLIQKYFLNITYAEKKWLQSFKLNL